MTPKEQGFSLIEILICLALMSNCSIVLLERQWQLSQKINGFTLSRQSAAQQINASEQTGARDEASGN